MTIAQKLIEQVSSNAARAETLDVSIGAHWVLVTLRLDGAVRAGLASNLGGGHSDHHGSGPPVRDAGRLQTYSALALVDLARARSQAETSVGFAAINALLDVDEGASVEVNAADVIAQRGAGRNVAIVGHFPFVPQIRDVAGTLWVLELRPREGDLPAAQAPAVLPQADVVALTGTSLLNGTFDGLLAHCRDDAFVIVLGATTPLSPLLFEAGASAVAGTRIVDAEAARLAVTQGATFRQIPGKRLLTLFAPGGASL